MCAFDVFIVVTVLSGVLVFSKELKYDESFMRNVLCPGCSRVKHMACGEVPDAALEEILGPAFNARYMSITEPKPSVETGENGKRNPSSDLEFYVDSQFYEDFDDQPAWAVKNHVEVQVRDATGMRYRRDADYKQEWQCESKIKWTDLGPDYFPRYLRSVECLSEDCWFGVYKCRPRSFTVKILRRKRNRCVTGDGGGRKTGSSGLPRELKELWVWEERAVSFCCDCSFMSRSDGR